jgi:hypothetical protein
MCWWLNPSDTRLCIPFTLSLYLLIIIYPQVHSSHPTDINRPLNEDDTTVDFRKRVVFGDLLLHLLSELLFSFCTRTARVVQTHFFSFRGEGPFQHKQPWSPRFSILRSGLRRYLPRDPERLPQATNRILFLYCHRETDLWLIQEFTLCNSTSSVTVACRSSHSSNP